MPDVVLGGNAQIGVVEVSAPHIGNQAVLRDGVIDIDVEFFFGEIVARRGPMGIGIGTICKQNTAFSLARRRIDLEFRRIFGVQIHNSPPALGDFTCRANTANGISM